MKNKKLTLIIWLSFISGAILNFGLTLLGAYFYANEHAESGDVSLGIKKGSLYINNALYSHNAYEFPYIYIISPVFGLLMAFVIVFFIKIMKENLSETLALHRFDRTSFIKPLIAFLVLSITFYCLPRYFPELNTQYPIQVPDNIVNAILMFLGVVIFMPIYEEFIFRGLIYKYYAEKGSEINAVTHSSLLFAMLHFHYGITTMLMIFTFSLLLGVSRKATNSIYPPIIFHILNNSMLFWGFY